MMPELMTLPRELRDKICQYVILAYKNTAPSLDSSFEELLESRDDYEAPDSGVVQYLISNDFVANVTDLCLVNRQLYSETLENLKILKEARHYDLDLIVLDEIILLPTWLRVPMLTTRVEQLNANFRISGRYIRMSPDNPIELQKYAEYDSYKGFYVSGDAPAAMSWQILSVLERFIKVGPVGEDKGGNSCRNVTVQKLNINVETPPNIDPSSFKLPVVTRDFDPEDQSVLDPEYLVQFIIAHLRYPLVHVIPYSKLLFEHLGEIIVHKDGKQRAVLDLATLLHEARFFNGRQWDEDTFGNWKSKIVETRRARALRILET